MKTKPSKKKMSPELQMLFAEETEHILESMIEYVRNNPEPKGKNLRAFNKLRKRFNEIVEILSFFGLKPKDLPVVPIDREYPLLP